MRYLLDANALISACAPEHVFYGPMQSWIKQNPEFAVCPITEGALVRFFIRSSKEGKELSTSVLKSLPLYAGYEFWPDEISYAAVDLQRVSGHKQVTDAYLVSLASARGSRLATFDTSLCAVHPEATLIPVEG